MKMNADKHRREARFEVDDMIYVKLQPYRQHSLAEYAKMKLAPRFGGPYSIVKHISCMTYQG